MSVRISGTLLAAAAAALVAAGCAGAEREDEQLLAALGTITADELVQHVKVLSSDEFEGRLPATLGEEKTLEYMQAQFSALGLQPGNGESWLQEVPLVSITADPTMTLKVSKGAETREFRYGNDLIAWTKRVVDRVDVQSSELVFVGHGVVAPEYSWNDYEGLDVKGKTVVVLVNDPGYATRDTSLFHGQSMTYYGRWTYKYEEAARQGAAAALIVHETEPAAYGWETVKGSWSGPQFTMVAADNNVWRAQVEGWISLETARAIFSFAGQSYDSLKVLASQRGFRGVPLGLQASISIQNHVQHSVSHNMLALLPGRERADEYIIFMSHWDHLGRDTSLTGDQIYNGALDNATGIGGLVELAQAFVSLETRPERSIIFMPVTAEEQGLLGSAYYGENPIYPLDKTVAALNIDGLNIYGRMKDIVVIGMGNSELDDYLRAAALRQGRAVGPDPEPEKGYFYRSDHFSLSKQGVPALYTHTGEESVEHGVEWTRQKKDEFTARHYHQPSDEYRTDWDLSGAVEDLQLFFMVGYQLANESRFPNWSPGSEFKAKRDAMMTAGSAR